MKSRLPSVALALSVLAACLAGACGSSGGDDAGSSSVLPGGTAGGSHAGASGHAAAGASGASAGSGGHGGTSTAGSGGVAGAANGGKGGAAASSGSGGTGGASAGAGGASGGKAGAGGGVTQSLDVSPPSTMKKLSLGGPTGTAAFTAAKMGVDVTASATWMIAPASIGTIKAGVVTLSGAAGVATVTASSNGATGSATLTVDLTGEVFGVGLDPVMTKDQFTQGTPDPTTPPPALEYPLDGVLLPSNLPSLDAQWSDDGDSTLFRLHLTTPQVDLTVYTDQRELVLPDAAWSALRSSTIDQPTTIQVTGLGSKGLHPSATQTLTVVSDALPESAIYVWQNSTATFHVLDILKGTDTLLPTPTPPGGGGCVGCHRISRDGKRFSYTATGAYLSIGTLAFDAAKQDFEPPAMPGSSLGTYATFYPLEAATGASAMLFTKPSYAGQNVPNDVILDLVDPDTYAPKSSDVAAMLAQLPPGLSTHALMPDWSPAGDFVTFVAYDGSQNFVRDPGDDVVLGRLWQSSVSYDPASGAFHFGAPEELVPTPDGDPDTGENNFLPTVSPDGAAIAFTRARGWWGVKTQDTSKTPLNISGRIAVVRRSDKQVFELAGGTAGPTGTWSSTWPQWAPSNGAHHAFLAFASERPYGHLLTPQNNQCTGMVQGQNQCKQLWIMAVDLKKLNDPTNHDADPSSPPFRIPGQPLNVQNVSPQWTVPALKL